MTIFRPAAVIAERSVSAFVGLGVYTARSGSTAAGGAPIDGIDEVSAVSTTAATISTGDGLCSGEV